MTKSEEAHHPGWIEAAARLLRVTLQSPRVRRGLDTVLGHLDPDFAGDLVDAALHTDPDLPHAVLGALPDGLNILIELTGGLAREVCGRPVLLVREVLDQIQARLRLRPLGQAMGLLLGRAVVLQRETQSRAPALAGQILDGVRAGLRREGVAPAEALSTLALWWIEATLAGIEQQLGQEPELAAGIAELSTELAALLGRHPEALQQVVVPLLWPLLQPVVSGGQGE